jgi:hypothetical protein
VKQRGERSPKLVIFISLEGRTLIIQSYFFSPSR